MRRHVFILLAVCAACLCPSATARAEIVLPSIEKLLTLTITPLHPQPGEVVHIAAQSAALDLQKAVIVWSRDDTIIVSGTGVASIDIPTGGFGEETDIKVNAIATDGTEVSATASIIPTGVDIVFDSNSYVPPFYRGRALPTAGTTMRFEAIPFLKSPGEPLVPADELTYTWRENDVVLDALSGRGKSSAVISAAHIFGDDTISVEVSNDDETLTGSASITIPSREARLELYEDHPLFGILYNKTLDMGGLNPIADTEMTFAAIPYFAPVATPDDTTLTYDWNVNGATIAPSAGRRSEITIGSSAQDTAAIVRLDVTQSRNYLMDINGAWALRFGSTYANDAFHVPTTSL